MLQDPFQGILWVTKVGQESIQIEDTIKAIIYTIESLGKLKERSLIKVFGVHYETSTRGNFTYQKI